MPNGYSISYEKSRRDGQVRCNNGRGLHSGLRPPVEVTRGRERPSVEVTRGRTRLAVGRTATAFARQKPPTNVNRIPSRVWCRPADRCRRISAVPAGGLAWVAVRAPTETLPIVVSTACGTERWEYSSVCGTWRRCVGPGSRCLPRRAWRGSGRRSAAWFCLPGR